jgi:hypothetical protein
VFVATSSVYNSNFKLLSCNCNMSKVEVSSSKNLPFLILFMLNAKKILVIDCDVQHGHGT